MQTHSLQKNQTRKLQWRTHYWVANFVLIYNHPEIFATGRKVTNNQSMYLFQSTSFNNNVIIHAYF